MKPIILLSLFGGIDGFAKGFIDAGYEIEKHYYSEIDKHASANCKFNFKTAIHLGSVTNIFGSGITRPNIITFGSPCQDFSLAGKRQGMGGARSSLITEAIRVVSECRPDIFIWENVKGAFSSNDGADFWAIIQAFANIGGYRLEWQLLNTARFLPQNRERIYLIGHLDGRSEPGIFPIGEESGILNESGPDAEKQIASCLMSGSNSHIANGEYKGMNLITNNKQGTDTLLPGDTLNFNNIKSKTRRGRVGKGKASTLDTQCNQAVIVASRGRLDDKGNWQQQYETRDDSNSNTLTGVVKDNYVKVAHVSRTDDAKNQRKESIKQGRDHTPFQNKQVEFVESDVMNTITCAATKDNLIETSGIRRLTEIECERLQGFPDDWTKFGIYENKFGVEETKPIPSTQRYRMCGNAVSTVVVKAIAEKLKLNL